jgi:hypothetical protein
MRPDLSIRYLKEHIDWSTTRELRPRNCELALRKTRLDWIGDSDARKRDPQYWAPFVLVERGCQ